MITMELDVTKYPGRNSGLPRRSRNTIASPSWKLKAGIHLLNVSLSAYSVELLGGDVSPNSGPGSCQDSLSFDGKCFPTMGRLKISHLNVRSIIYKMCSFRLLLKTNPSDIFTVPETWLNSNILNCELSVQGYSFVRQDCRGRAGSGCMIYVRKGLPYRIQPDSQDNIESCVIMENRSKCKRLFLWTIYRAPDQSLDNFIDILNSKMVLLLQDAEVILLGDFSIDFLATKRVSGFSLKHKHTLFANTHDLNQLTEIPTRLADQSSSAIDLLFVYNKHRVVSGGVLAVHISDHSLTYCVVKSGIPKGLGRKIEYRSYKHYSKEVFLAYLRNVDWDAVDKISDIEIAVNFWIRTPFTRYRYGTAPVSKYHGTNLFTRLRFHITVSNRCG